MKGGSIVVMQADSRKKADRRDEDGLVAVADIIDTERAAEILGNNVSWTTTLARFGQLPVLKKLGTERHPRYLFDRRAIEDFAREKNVKKAQATAGGRK